MAGYSIEARRGGCGGGLFCQAFGSLDILRLLVGVSAPYEIPHTQVKRTPLASSRRRRALGLGRGEGARHRRIVGGGYRVGGGNSG